MMTHEFVVTSTRSMHSYAARVVDQLLKYKSLGGMKDIINCVDALQTDRFADGELEVSLNRSIRGRNVVLFTTCARNEADLCVEEAKIELYHTIDVLSRSQARKIMVFEPYVSCSRSDRTTRRNSVGLWVHFKTLVSLGVRQIVTYQLHSDKSTTMLDPTLCVLDDIPGFNLLSKYICDNYIKDMETLQETVRKEWAFCSVDAGGENTARIFANAFGAGLVIAHKQRDYSRANTIESINILSAEPLEGKKLWIVDDMIDTGASVERLVRTLAARHPAEINIVVVHAPFSHPAAERISALFEERLLNHLIVTDTVLLSPEVLQKIPRIELVSSAELSANIIRTITTGDSMTGLRGRFNAANYLKRQELF
ncbi:MAG: ribose-phosphate diphosphokinase [Spirochaetaceae bacterium]|jgi:ribose-phosphate pyrophosphokinase|nr:ribose-phosphate diphosphokinase [Spirochaetaceae bacterium]